MSEQLQLTEKTPSIYELLRTKYAAPEWALMEEVAPKTGGGTRYADAVAVNLWQSRGHAVNGFEVKVSRSDWLRELKQPEKADPVMRYCDYWWLVSEKGVVKPGELPINWGHMERSGNSLRVATAAPKLEAQPLTREFFASLMRRGHEQLESIASKQWANKHAEMLRVQQAEIADRVRYATRDAEALREQVRKFEAATGITISQYSSPIPMVALAKRLANLQGFDSSGALGRLQHLSDQLEDASSKLRAALTESGLGQ